MTLSERLAKIEARRNAATPGPWESNPGDSSVMTAYTVECVGHPCRVGIADTSLRDTQFIASAPQDIEFLLAALKRAITVADDACDKECNPKTCSPCKLLAYLERLASKESACE